MDHMERFPCTSQYMSAFYDMLNRQVPMANLLPDDLITQLNYGIITSFDVMKSVEDLRKDVLLHYDLWETIMVHVQLDFKSDSIVNTFLSTTVQTLLRRLPTDCEFVAHFLERVNSGLVVSTLVRDFMKLALDAWLRLGCQDQPEETSLNLLSRYTQYSYVNQKPLRMFMLQLLFPLDARDMVSSLETHISQRHEEDISLARVLILVAHGMVFVRGFYALLRDSVVDGLGEAIVSRQGWRFHMFLLLARRMCSQLPSPPGPNYDDLWSGLWNPNGRLQQRLHLAAGQQPSSVIVSVPPVSFVPFLYEQLVKMLPFENSARTLRQQMKYLPVAVRQHFQLQTGLFDQAVRQRITEIELLS